MHNKKVRRFIITVFVLLALVSSCTNGSSDNSNADNEYSASSMSFPEEVVATKGVYLNAVGVSWKKVDEADSYKVFRSDTDGESFDGISQFIQETNYLDKEAMAGKQYLYKVRAYAGDDTSELSDPTEGYMAYNEKNWEFYQTIVQTVRIFFYKASVSITDPLNVKGHIDGEYYENYKEEDGLSITEGVFNNYNNDGHIVNGTVHLTPQSADLFLMTGKLYITGGTDDGEAEFDLYYYMPESNNKFITSRDIFSFDYDNGYVYLKSDNSGAFSRCEPETFLYDISQLLLVTNIHGINTISPGAFNSFSESPLLICVVEH